MRKSSCHGPGKGYEDHEKGIIVKVKIKRRRMKKRLKGLALLLCLGTLLYSCTVGDMERMGTLLTGGASGELTEEEVIRGLTEALRTGAERAVKKAGEENGYWADGAIRIPLPPMIRKAENLLKMAGFGSRVEEFHRSMNRAAEKAAPLALDVFWDVIRGMTFSDAWGILNGGDRAATDYFKSKSYDRLSSLLKPLVRKAMSEVGVTAYYQDIETKIRTLPVQILDEDLDSYVTGRALDGLFLLLAREEEKIRKDPAARTSDILRRVFGNL